MDDYFGFKQHKTYKVGKWKTSDIELWDIFKAWLAISIAFGVILGGRSLFSFNFLQSFILAGLTVGVGFLFHELGHKIVAQKYGCFAEFRAFNSMLILAIAMSFFGFVFAAPGAVFISGNVGVARNGRISVIGAVINLILAVMFLVIGLLVPGEFFSLMGHYGFMINSWLALFNMIPFGPLDGKKVLNWNKGVYFSVLAIAGFFVFGLGSLV